MGGATANIKPIEHRERDVSSVPKDRFLSQEEM